MARLIVPPAGFIELMLPTLLDEAPNGEAWVYKINTTATEPSSRSQHAYTRNGYDWTDKYEIVVAAAES